MLSSVYLKTLRDLRGLILVWGLGLAAAGALNVISFPTFQKLPEMVTFLKNLPPFFKSLLGDIEAVMTLEGFLKPKVFNAMPLLLGIFGISQGARALTGELEQKTCDLLLAQPLPRRRVVLDKFLAIVTALILISVMMLAGLLVSCIAFGPEVNQIYLLLGICNGLPLAMVFTALALVGSAAMSSSRHAAVLGGFTMMTCFIFETIRPLSPALAGWRVVSPFAHQQSAVGFAGNMALSSIFVFTGLTAVLVIVAVWFFDRRDLAG